jgi:hypothetical protein
MNRRDFLKSGIIGAGAAVAIPNVALADHISEPTGPVSGIGFHLYHYTNRAATFQALMQSIPQDGVQPPNSTPVTVEIHADPDPNVVTGTLTAYQTHTIADTLPRDPTFGLPVINFPMRVEPKVHVYQSDRPGGAPSEHWTEALRLNVVTGHGTGRRRRKYAWAVPWNHANVPPHANFNQGFWETAQANQSLELIPPGTVLEFEHIMKCHESKRHFYQSLTFMTG